MARALDRTTGWTSSLRRKWLNAIHRSDFKPASHRHLRVCSDHFITGQPSHLADTGNPDWVSTRKLGYDTSRTFGSPNMRRHERVQNRRAKRTMLDRSDEESSSVDQGKIHCEEELGTGCQTDLSQRDIDALQQELERPRRTYLKGNVPVNVFPATNLLSKTMIEKYCSTRACQRGNY